MTRSLRRLVLVLAGPHFLDEVCQDRHTAFVAWYSRRKKQVSRQMSATTSSQWTVQPWKHQTGVHKSCLMRIWMRHCRCARISFTFSAACGCRVCVSLRALGYRSVTYNSRGLYVAEHCRTETFLCTSSWAKQGAQGLPITSYPRCGGPGIQTEPYRYRRSEEVLIVGSRGMPTKLVVLEHTGSGHPGKPALLVTW